MNELKEYKKKQAKIVEKENELARQNKIVKESYDALMKEKGDVSDLEEAKISTLFSKLTGSFEQRKEKEQQEVFQAENYFIQTRKHQMEIIHELEVLKQELRAIIPSQEDYFRIFKEKMERLIDDVQVQRYRQTIEASQRGLQDAQSHRETMREALKVIADMESDLSIATSASVIDMIGVPVVGDGLKYAKLGQLSKKVETLNDLLHTLRRSKVDGVVMNGDMIAFGAIDLLADNVVMDAIALGHVLKIKKNIDHVEDQLNADLKLVKNEEKSYIKLLKDTSTALERYIIEAE